MMRDEEDYDEKRERKKYLNNFNSHKSSRKEQFNRQQPHQAMRERGNIIVLNFQLKKTYICECRFWTNDNNNQ
jgi:hypothetical protein